MQRLTTTQQIQGSVSFLNSQGQPAKVDGVPVWTTSDAGVVSVEASEDGLSVVVKSVGEGTAVVTLEADADLGEGVRSIVGTEDFQVLPAEAVSVALTFQAPTEQ